MSYNIDLRIICYFRNKLNLKGFYKVILFVVGVGLTMKVTLNM